ncbi:hypothetical protein DXT89_16290 [Agrobacterium vitis]|uniref:Uncharacterized protein n=1 Tax=Agrobacterium vitis TaxID=373 RepID=A0A368NEQ4_AGRVI|nr:hypothetical protein DXM22_15870 [Agrobacterium vitis]KAA3526085.1 hypothetical protein DXT89_16290 [Agrobacterium vitis]RCU48968.1 hypothetical protein ASB66_025180 [Agrobacterium vitis]
MKALQSKYRTVRFLLTRFAMLVKRRVIDKAEECRDDMKKGEFQAKAPSDFGSRKTLKTERRSISAFH